MCCTGMQQVLLNTLEKNPSGNLVIFSILVLIFMSFQSFYLGNQIFIPVLQVHICLMLQWVSEDSKMANYSDRFRQWQCRTIKTQDFGRMYSFEVVSSAFLFLVFLFFFPFLELWRSPLHPILEYCSSRLLIQIQLCPWFSVFVYPINYKYAWTEKTFTRYYTAVKCWMSFNTFCRKWPF